MILINYEEFFKQSTGKIGYLQGLCNKHGDFKVAKAWKHEDGEMRWTKHLSVLQCSESDNGLYFLNEVNNRTSLPSEIVLDVDENPSIELFNEICDFIEYRGLHYKGYESGGKGFHIHVMIPDLATRPGQWRERVKGFVISKFKCDFMKKSERSMIALENTPHWRTGKIKKMIRCYHGPYKGCKGDCNGWA